MLGDTIKICRKIIFETGPMHESIGGGGGIDANLTIFHKIICQIHFVCMCTPTKIMLPMGLINACVVLSHFLPPGVACTKRYRRAKLVLSRRAKDVGTTSEISWFVGRLVVFNVPSTARSFRDGAPYKLSLVMDVKLGFKSVPTGNRTLAGPLHYRCATPGPRSKSLYLRS